MNFSLLPTRKNLACSVALLALALLINAVAAPATSQSLPVLLRGAGNWLNATTAVQTLPVMLAPEGQSMALKNSWKHGSETLLIDEELGSGLLFLSNVWTYASDGLSEEVFWSEHGLTNTPMRLVLPGESGYYLPIANNRVLPFVGRWGTLAPAAIWAWPKLPVKLNGTARGEADISNCKLASFENGAINLSGRLGGTSRQKWRLSATGGLLRLQLELSTDADW